MANPKYTSTNEKTNAVRLSRLLVDPCTDLFRAILRDRITEIQFPCILNKEKNNLFHILYKDQREILYPKSGFTGIYEEFDLSLLYILLRNISGIHPHQNGWGKSPDPIDRSLSANIERIREIRNTHCGHAPCVSLPDPEFQKHWQNITVIISELERSLPGGCTTYTNAAKMLQTETMDPEQEKKFLDIIDQQHKSTEDLKETTKELKKEQEIQRTKLEMLKSEFTQGQKRKAEQLQLKTTERKKLKTEQNKQAIEIKKLKHEQNQQRFKLHSIKRKIMSKSLSEEKINGFEGQNIIGNTLAVLKAHKLQKVIARTSAVQNTIDKLRNNHLAILTGKEGTGKTTTAYQVLWEMSNPSFDSPCTPVLIISPEQWDKVIKPSFQYIVYLDDVFASETLDKMAVQKWKNQINVMFACAKTGNVMVLIGLRSKILAEVKKMFKHAILNEENIVDLSLEKNFTIKDKANILDAYEENCNFKASELRGDSFTEYAEENGINAVYRLRHDEKIGILFADSYYGFPMTCSNFFSNRDFFQIGTSYFECLDEKLLETIENMRRGNSGNIHEKVKYCVLCYVSINGSIEPNRISKKLLNSICERLRIFQIHDIELKDAITDLDGLFLRKITPISENLYEFSHESVLEGVIVSFGQLAPDIVIRNCSRRQLHKLIHTQKYQSKPGEVVLKVQKINYWDLAQRLIGSDDNDFLTMIFPWIVYEVSLHPGFDDPDFLSVFLSSELKDKITTHLQNVRINRAAFSMFHTENLLKVLELCGPHHATQEHSHSQNSGAPTFQITVEHIQVKLQQIFLSKKKYCILKTIISYIHKYRNIRDIRNLLQTKICSGLTVVQYCVMQGWKNLVDLILEIDTPTKTDLNWSCAHLAAYGGRSLLLHKFIDLGQNITEKTTDGYTVLLAAFLGLRYGDKKRRNKSDLPTALHVAVYLGRAAMVKKLWAFGVRPQERDLSLMQTHNEGEMFCNKRIVYTQLKRKLDPNVYDSVLFKLCWNDGNNEVLDLKLRATEEVEVDFGGTKEFQEVCDFLEDNLGRE
ncbi:uncharacterized protein LOC134259398 [Saccostrea cucullata]|uniref:uncharacterized protein LOC134259398 n=1 Tax=Saccostrea cuccullata TaxID=36930 RepID=UPI002ED53665